MQTQLQKVFWNSDSTRQSTLPNVPAASDVRLSVSANNQACPLNKIIVCPANEGNMRELRTRAFTACKRFNHSPRFCDFSIFAESGQGKSFVVEQFAKTLGIPTVIIRGKAVTDTWGIFMEMQKACEAFDTPLIRQQGHSKGAIYVLPPMIVFWDEAHRIPKGLAEGDLLPVMEGDRLMSITEPRTKPPHVMLVDCLDVAWIFATTEKGKLFHALRTRSPQIEWQCSPPDVVARIVKQKIDEYEKEGVVPFTMPMDACEMVAEYYRVPREARDFAVAVVLRKDMIPSFTWKDSIQAVASDKGVGGDGFTAQEIDILTAMGQRPMAQGRLSVPGRCQKEEIDDIILPRLLRNDRLGRGGPFVVPMSGKGICITQAALKVLDGRGISHKGERVTAEYFESRR